MTLNQVIVQDIMAILATEPDISMSQLHKRVYDGRRGRPADFGTFKESYGFLLSAPSESNGATESTEAPVPTDFVKDAKFEYDNKTGKTSTWKIARMEQGKTKKGEKVTLVVAKNGKNESTFGIRTLRAKLENGSVRLVA